MDTQGKCDFNTENQKKNKRIGSPNILRTAFLLRPRVGDAEASNPPPPPAASPSLPPTSLPLPPTWEKLPCMVVELLIVTPILEIGHCTAYNTGRCSPVGNFTFIYLATPQLYIAVTYEQKMNLKKIFTLKTKAC